METIKRKMLISISLVIVLLVSFIAYVNSHPHSFKYNDKWIIGRSYDEIVKRYGEFDMGSDTRKLYKDDTMWFWDKLINSYWRTNQDYYHVFFDENGIAKRISRGGPLGG
jgi:hypothetical protein